MLHEFLTANRKELISRCAIKVIQRTMPKATEKELQYGIPAFLDQLIDLLREESNTLNTDVHSTGKASTNVTAGIGLTAAKHGRELLMAGFTVGQVVHNYGELCQAIGELASERKEEIKTLEFKALNKCLDYAIAGAVAEYELGFELIDSKDHVNAGGLDFLQHELKLIETATLAVDAIKRGYVGIAGSTSDVLVRNLKRLQDLTTSAIEEARLKEGKAAHQEAVLISEFIADTEAIAALDAKSHGLKLMVPVVESELGVKVERQVLADVVMKLLQNAFKFATPGSRVWLRALSSLDRVLIEVEDECGGLTAGTAEKLSGLLEQQTGDLSSMGSSIFISGRVIMANGGKLHVRNLPGQGCVFTIDFPRLRLSTNVAA